MSRPSRSEAGFTLMELLVAVTLLGFLSVALVAGLRFGTDVWRKSESKNIDTNTMRAAQKILSDDLARIYPKYVAVAATQGYVDFDGTARGLTFLSTARGHVERERLQTVKTRDGLAMRIDTAPELARANAGGSSMTLLAGLSWAEFSYFGVAADSKAPAWHDTWQNQRALPSLIRIRAGFAGRGATPWPDMILTPRIGADVGCVFDAITKFCQGRS